VLLERQKIDEALKVNWNQKISATAETGTRAGEKHRGMLLSQVEGARKGREIVTQEQKPVPKCLKCGNEDKFEVLDSNWAVDEMSGKHYYVEKVRCDDCGFVHRAKYELVLWEEEKVKCQTKK